MIFNELEYDACVIWTTFTLFFCPFDERFHYELLFRVT